MYSNWIKINSPSNLSESRLAWCYGDLGIAKALNYAGVSLGNSDITNFSFEVLNKTIPRFMNSHVEDASFVMVLVEFLIYIIILPDNRL